jgi:hypothetical protein
MHGETLFHFTQDFNTLISILDDQAFQAHLSRETLVYINENGNLEELPPVLVPMVSFCDYKLSEISHHALNYGYYALGMTKEWAITNKLNPVLYLSENSDIAAGLRSLNKILEKIQKNNICHNLEDEIFKASLKAIEIYAWTKNYQGLLKRNGKNISNFRFADDKEWRYVARMWEGNSEPNDKPLIEAISTILDSMRFIPEPNPDCSICGKPAKKCPDHGNVELRLRKDILEQDYINPDTRKLSFSWCDIRFILVRKITDRQQLIKTIKEKFSSSDSNINVDLLCEISSKIIVIDDLDLRALFPAQ